MTNRMVESANIFLRKKIASRYRDVYEVLKSFAYEPDNKNIVGSKKENDFMSLDAFRHAIREDRIESKKNSKSFNLKLSKRFSFADKSVGLSRNFT